MTTDPADAAWLQAQYRLAWRAAADARGGRRGNRNPLDLCHASATARMVALGETMIRLVCWCRRRPVGPSPTTDRGGRLAATDARGADAYIPNHPDSEEDPPMTAEPVAPDQMHIHVDSDGAIWLRADDVIASFRISAARMVVEASERRANGEGFTADCLETTARALHFRADQFDVMCISAASRSQPHDHLARRRV